MTPLPAEAAERMARAIWPHKWRDIDAMRKDARKIFAPELVAVELRSAADEAAAHCLKSGEAALTALVALLRERGHEDAAKLLEGE